MDTWTSESDDSGQPVPLTDIDEALRYAEQTGQTLFDPYDLDGTEYDADSIRSDFYDGHGQRLTGSPLTAGD